MSDIKQTSLPGIGIRYEFVTEEGERVAVIHHRTGRRELLVFSHVDPDLCLESVDLTERDSRTLVELLGGAQIAEQLEELHRQQIEGLAVDWLQVREGAPYAGRTIGETHARTRTGSSIIAVLRGGEAIPAPGPDFRLEAGDNLVVVGTGRGVAELIDILRAG